MTRLVEVLVGLSALAGIATFLGFRTAFRATVRKLGRKPESPQQTYRTPGGRELTETDIEQFSKEAEHGYDVEHLKR